MGYGQQPKYCNSRVKHTYNTQRLYSEIELEREKYEAQYQLQLQCSMLHTCSARVDSNMCQHNGSTAHSQHTALMLSPSFDEMLKASTWV